MKHRLWQSDIQKIYNRFKKIVNLTPRIKRKILDLRQALIRIQKSI